MKFNGSSPDIENEMSVIRQEERVLDPKISFNMGRNGAYVLRCTMIRITPVVTQNMTLLRIFKNDDLKNNLKYSTLKSIGAPNAAMIVAQ